MRPVERKKLPRVDGTKEALGIRTIMDRALAARHGVPYVHLAAFAIDVDRVRDEVEGYGDRRPFGWEVFLTEAYVLERAKDERALLEDVVLSILDGQPDALGSQLVFAIWDAIHRAQLPRDLRKAFASWKAEPDELVEKLAPLWKKGADNIRELAQGCLAVEIDPPLAPPTRASLEALAR
jgi:hypothetical protein